MTRHLLCLCLLACQSTPAPPSIEISVPTARSASPVPRSAIGCDGEARIDVVDHGIYFNGTLLVPLLGGRLLSPGSIGRLAATLETSPCSPRAAWLRMDAELPLSTVAAVAATAAQHRWQLAAVVEVEEPPPSPSPPHMEGAEVIEIASSTEGTLATALPERVDIIHVIAPESGNWAGLAAALDSASARTPCIEVRLDDVERELASPGQQTTPTASHRSPAPEAMSLHAFEWPIPDRSQDLPRWSEEPRTLLSGTRCPGSGIDLVARAAAQRTAAEAQRAADAPVVNQRETRNALLESLVSEPASAPETAP